MNSQLNFYAGIAKTATEHFQNVWKEAKALTFDLVPHGDNLIPGVRELNRYDFSMRSDGFKRFATFLLLISAKVKTGALSNTLLLIDEPEISLHPSGARFLRDELIRISKTNYVVYSTHSIFMIDREDIERHILVKKSKEITAINVANGSNFVDEEVVYNALGHSIFDVLKEKNLIFEGWKDKRLYQVATKKLPPAHSGLKEVVGQLGVCHAKGVGQIKSITPIIELARRECIIISDADAPAKQHQKEYVDLNGYGTWKRYDEILPGKPIITGEDFLKSGSFKGPIQEVKSRYSSLPEFDEKEMNTTAGKLNAIDEWLKSGHIDKAVRQAEIKKIKDAVFAKLKLSDIEDYYFDFLTNLVALV